MNESLQNTHKFGLYTRIYKGFCCWQPQIFVYAWVFFRMYLKKFSNFSGNSVYIYRASIKKLKESGYSNNSFDRSNQQKLKDIYIYIYGNKDYLLMDR